MFKILIADDEAIERNTLKEILEENLSAVSVRTVADGIAALELASLWGADLALLDIEMPGMNGIKAATGIRKLLPNCQIVFLTAYGLFEYAQEALRLGVSDYLLKPAEDADVLHAVRKALAAISSSDTDIAQAEPLLNIPSCMDATFSTSEQPPCGKVFEKDGQVDKNTKLLRQVQLYLEANFAHDISLESIAETLNFSPFYLSKILKQSFGTTFIEYLTDLRIGAAKEYLSDNTLSAKEIGERVGYPNSNYFMKVFKKKTGMTPTEYRNSL